jgi:hypothetical protein
MPRISKDKIKINAFDSTVEVKSGDPQSTIRLETLLKPVKTVDPDRIKINANATLKFPISLLLILLFKINNLS